MNNCMNDGDNGLADSWVSYTRTQLYVTGVAWTQKIKSGIDTSGELDRKLNLIAGAVQGFKIEKLK